jgi:uncharacterized membrane protein
MTTFTVWKFDDPEGAQAAAAILKGVEAERLIKVLDHAVVTWPVGSPGPTLKRTHDSTWHDTGWGALWGLLIGSLFFVPLLGAAAGAGIGAIHQATEGIGIGKDDLEKIRTQVTEGTSALMVITDEGKLDQVAERFHGMHWTLVDTNLTDAERKMLIEAFGGG